MSDTLLSPSPEAPEVIPEVTPSPDATPQPESIITPPGDRDWTKAIKADGSFDKAAHEYGVPEHWKSVGGIIESYKELQRVKGAPGPEATPEQVKAYRDANGIPEVANAQQYGIELPPELQDVYEEGSIDRVIKAANENAHLGHAEMMKAMISEFTAMEVEGLKAKSEATEAEQKAKLEAAAKMLESDPNFAGERKTAALQTTANGFNAALSALGEDPDSDSARELARNPLAVRIIHHFASKTGQDTTDMGSSISDLRSKEEQADDIINNSSNPEYAAYHAGDTIVQQKVLKLMGAV